MPKSTREDILKHQLNMLDILAEAQEPGWLCVRNAQARMGFRGLPVTTRFIQQHLRAFVNLGLVVIHPKDLAPHTPSIRYRKAPGVSVTLIK